MAGLETETELFLMLQEAFDVEKECEHRQHFDPRFRRDHSGKAEWYIQVQCDSCGHSKGVVPVCDKWVRAAESGGVQCSECGWVMRQVVFLVKERIRNV